MWENSRMLLYSSVRPMLNDLINDKSSQGTSDRCVAPDIFGRVSRKTEVLLRVAAQ